MNACRHYGKPSCVHPGKRASVGTCSRCSAYVDSGEPRGVVAVTLRVKAQPQPIPRDQWPILARIIARLASATDKGVGDTIARSLGSPGEWFKTAFKTLTGKSCGCSDRQAHLNALYSY